ncbi:MAG: saccharopine dehydrogenase NADP-binding domain-containing protein [Bacteroidales bacterium]|nr:saccharopine dehydrogenase NADP-binding domain-containing protein [Bacteroidales bacterium]
MKVIVLGAGLIGKPIAVDLANENEFDVSIADINKTALSKINHKDIHKIEQDLGDSDELRHLIKDYDLVLSAVPGYMGFKTLKAIIEAGKNAVDIAFFSEDLFELDKLARKQNVTVIADMGIAPGMSNVLIGHVDHVLDYTENISIYVAGLPKLREWPFEYKAVFSPIDVIEEYTRPARIIQNGEMITKPALSDVELIDMPKVGTLEAFNTDGLRSLMKTIDARNMVEKTMRYKGHIEKIAMLREIGLFSKEPVEFHGMKVRPLDFTARLLFPKWKLNEGDEDITVMKIIIEGKKADRTIRTTYHLHDEFDNKAGIHSMARTTGFSATAALRMIAVGVYSMKGVSAPEFIGKCPECVGFIFKRLKERGIQFVESTEEVNHY